MPFNPEVHYNRICVNIAISEFPSIGLKELPGCDFYTIQRNGSSELTLYMAAVAVHYGSEIEKES